MLMAQILYTPTGDFYNFVDILAPGTRQSDGSYGDQTVFASQVPAAMRPSTATEKFQTQQITGEVTEVITVKYSDETAGIRQSMQIRDSDGVIYQIIGILDPDHRKVELRIHVVRRNDGL